MLMNFLYWTMAGAMLAPIALFIITRLAWRGGWYFPSLRICTEIQDSLSHIDNRIQDIKQSLRRIKPKITPVGILSTLVFLPLMLTNTLLLAQIIEICQPTGRQMIIPVLGIKSDLLSILLGASVCLGMTLFAYLSVKSMAKKGNDSKRQLSSLPLIIQGVAPFFWLSVTILGILTQGIGSLQRTWILIEQSGAADSYSAGIIQKGYIFSSLFSMMIPITMINTGLISLSELLSSVLTIFSNYSILLMYRLYYWFLKVFFVFQAPTAKNAGIINNIKSMAKSGDTISRITNDLPTIRNAVTGMTLPSPAEELEKLDSDIKKMGIDAENFLKEKKTLITRLQNINNLEEEWMERNGLIQSAISAILAQAGSFAGDIDRLRTGIHEMGSQDNNSMHANIKRSEMMVFKSRAALEKITTDIREMKAVHKNFSDEDFDFSKVDEISAFLYKRDIVEAREFNNEIPEQVERMEREMDGIWEIVNGKIQLIDEILQSLKTLKPDLHRIGDEMRDVEYTLRDIKSLVPYLNSIKRNMVWFLVRDLLRVIKCCIVDLIERSFRAASDILSIVERTIILFFDKLRLILTTMNI